MYGACWNQFILYFYLLAGAAGIAESRTEYKDSLYSLFDGGMAAGDEFITKQTFEKHFDLSGWKGD